MAENLDILNAVVSLLIRAAALAVQFSGRVCRQSLKGLPSPPFSSRFAPVTDARTH